MEKRKVSQQLKHLMIASIMVADRALLGILSREPLESKLTDSGPTSSTIPPYSHGCEQPYVCFEHCFLHLPVRSCIHPQIRYEKKTTFQIFIVTRRGTKFYNEKCNFNENNKIKFLIFGRDSDFSLCKLQFGFELKQICSL